MKITKNEQSLVKSAIYIGEQVGFGNLIAHLASAWAEMLIRVYGMSEETALEATRGRGPYPIAMHRDLIDRGEWDETGERYKQEPTS